MKKRAQYVLFFSALLISAPLKADVLLTFDDVFPGNGQTIVVPAGYHALDWDKVFILNPTGIPGPSGLINGLVSQPNLAIIRNSADFYSPALTPFGLGSADFTSAAEEGQSVTVNGYLGGLNGTLEDTVTFTVTATGPTLEVFNWSGIDAVSITTSGGTLIPGYVTNGTGYLGIDDITLPRDPAPEPGTLFLLVPAIGLLALSRLHRAHL